MTKTELFTKIEEARERLQQVVVQTPLLYNHKFSNLLGANVYWKREDLQSVRSYKIRGAFNKIAQLSDFEKKTGVVCASAGNHAQGVALACSKLEIEGIIFMPATTPKQKINQVKLFGGECIQIILQGDTFDDAYNAAIDYCNLHSAVFVHPFDDYEVIAGQGTIGLEILESSTEKIDYLFVPIGGGGLAAGLCAVFDQLSPQTKIIGVEPLGAPSMKTSMENGINMRLETIDKFVDGASVKKVGDKNFDICKNQLSDVVLVPEGKVCSSILQLYNEEAMVVEPAGALTIAALDLFPKDQLRGKNVVCIISGSNNDITRTEEIRERSLLHEGLKHYFLIEFPQRPGALKEFVTDVLGPEDDITYFQFAKKTNRENGPAIVGIELRNKDDFRNFQFNITSKNFKFTYLNENQLLFSQLIS